MSAKTSFHARSRPMSTSTDSKDVWAPGRNAPLSEPKSPMPEQHQRSPGLESRLKPRPHYEGAQYRPAGKLQGQRALITGGDSGIGRAVAVLYAREGAR